MEKFNLLLRFYFHISPEQISAMDDDEFYETVNGLLWVLEFNGTMQKAGINTDFKVTV